MPYLKAVQAPVPRGIFKPNPGPRTVQGNFPLLKLPQSRSSLMPRENHAWDLATVYSVRVMGEMGAWDFAVPPSLALSPSYIYNASVDCSRKPLPHEEPRKPLNSIEPKYYNVRVVR